ncbi:MAG: hypothetical protein AAFQ16_05275 [Pseudomonadota bacterium]
MIAGNLIQVGNGGNGAVTRSDSQSAAGEGGWSVGVYDATNDDGVTPVLTGNTITPGNGGTGGATNGGNGFSGETNF